MKLLNNKVVVVLLVVVAGLLLANLVSLWMQQAGTRGQTASGSNEYTLVPIASGDWSGMPAGSTIGGNVFWGMFAILRGDSVGEACVFTYDPVGDNPELNCSTWGPW